MAKIIVSDAAQFGIQGVTKSKPVKSERYKELVKESDKKIERNHIYYANAYKKAFSCLAR